MPLAFRRALTLEVSAFHLLVGKKDRNLGKNLLCEVWKTDMLDVDGGRVEGVD